MIKCYILGIAGVALVLLSGHLLALLLAFVSGSVGLIGQCILLAVFVGCAVGVNFWANGEEGK